MPNTRTANAVRLEFTAESLAKTNLSADWLRVVGSHGFKRKNARAHCDHAGNAKRLSKVTLDRNRRLLACLPIEPDGQGQPCLVRKARDGRRALRLKGDAQDNRLLLGLRGPVLRGWSAILEVAVEARGDHLRLAPLDNTGTLLRKHFLQLDGLGIRDLHFSGDDLYILAGPTIVLNGEIRVFKWPRAKPALQANREPVRFEADLTASVSLPHGRGTNRAEAICDLPPTLAGGKPSWLVLYDAPGEDRRDGEHTVFGDLLHHH